MAVFFLLTNFNLKQMCLFGKEKYDGIDNSTRYVGQGSIGTMLYTVILRN